MSSSGTPRVLIDKVGVIAMLDTLEHLVKGGRVGGARAMLGQVLAIKPLLELTTGRGRSRSAANEGEGSRRHRRRGTNHTPVRRLAIVHGDSSERQALEALISDIPIEFPLIIADMGPTVGTTVVRIIGVAWLEA